MGHIAADIDAAGNEFIYIPGIERVWRMLVGKDRLELDESWSPRYRDANGEQGLSWDGCLSDGALWLMGQRRHRFPAGNLRPASQWPFLYTKRVSELAPACF